jgi:hypothetical protein
LEKAAEMRVELMTDANKQVMLKHEALKLRKKTFDTNE